MVILGPMRCMRCRAAVYFGTLPVEEGAHPGKGNARLIRNVADDQPHRCTLARLARIPLGEARVAA